MSTLPKPLKYGGEHSDEYVTGWNACGAAMFAMQEQEAQYAAHWQTLIDAITIREPTDVFDRIKRSVMDAIDSADGCPKDEQLEDAVIAAIRSSHEQ